MVAQWRLLASAASRRAVTQYRIFARKESAVAS